MRIKIGLLLSICLLFVGCVSQKHSYAVKTTVVGMELAYSEIYNLPLMRLGYISSEGAACENGTAIIKREYKLGEVHDISSELILTDSSRVILTPANGTE